MKHNRRHFIKSASLAFGTTVLAAPYMVRGKMFHGMFHGKSNHEIRGAVCSGNGGVATPLANAIVNLYEATGGLPRWLGTGTTDNSGIFSIRFHPPGWGSDGIFYLTADLPGGLQLVSIVGPNLLPFVVINELTTVAAGYAFAQFAAEGVVMGDSFGLQIAAGMNENLVMPVSGESSPVITSSPNADQTNSWRSTLSLANLLALFVQNNGDSIDALYALATPPGGNPPMNLLQALSNIARFPGQNVAEIYALATQVSVYTPALAGPPDAWTIVVKVNDTGDDNYLFGGPGNIAFDDDGYAWITNNVVQGTGGSSRFAVVLKPNGQPADGRHGKPRSPLLGGGLLGGGIGVSIAPNGHVWFGNYGWGVLPKYMPSPDGNGSISVFTKNGRPISGPLGYQGGPVRAQAVVPDAHGNIWIASFKNDRIYVFLKGNPHRSVYYQQPSKSGPFGIKIANDGTAWVSNSGGLRAGGQGSIARYKLKNGRLHQIFFLELGHSNKQLVLDSQGYAWMASGGDDLVYRVNGRGTMYQGYVNKSAANRGGMNAPWGIAVDGDDNVWVGNFGPEEVGNNFTTSNITKLAGSNPATRPPGYNTGDAISPPTGYTLPSAGDEVLLHNGAPLYSLGPDPFPNPCFNPLMRITALTIDRAGNIWATNNWKPDFTIDLVNSGGDGICIFVGLAKPPARKHCAGHRRHF